MPEVPPLCQHCSFASAKDKIIIFSFRHCTMIYIGEVQPLCLPWIYLSKALTFRTINCLLVFPQCLCCSPGFGSHCRAEVEDSRLKQWVPTAPVREPSSCREWLSEHICFVCAPEDELQQQCCVFLQTPRLSVGPVTTTSSGLGTAAGSLSVSMLGKCHAGDCL